MLMILRLVLEVQQVQLTLHQLMIVSMKEMKLLLFQFQVFQVQMQLKVVHNRLLLQSLKMTVHLQSLLQLQLQVLLKMQDHL